MMGRQTLKESTPYGLESMRAVMLGDATPSRETKLYIADAMTMTTSCISVSHKPSQSKKTCSAIISSLKFIQKRLPFRLAA